MDKKEIDAIVKETAIKTWKEMVARGYAVQFGEPCASAEEAKAKGFDQVIGEDKFLGSTEKVYSKETWKCYDACGFASVHICAKQLKQVNELKRLGLSISKNYSSGFDLSLPNYEHYILADASSKVKENYPNEVRATIGQSITIKEAIANALADYLQKNGIRAYGQSRLD
jgi:pyruvate formate-lyase activating enzyme-like uncharacterized protein